MNLASTTITSESGKVLVKCALAGSEAKISLTSMRNIQNFSPARILDVKAQLAANTLYLQLEITDTHTRLTCVELDVLRVRKRKRVFFGS